GGAERLSSTDNGNGYNGYSPGGGGGGAKRGGSGSYNGGNGGNGQVLIFEGVINNLNSYHGSGSRDLYPYGAQGRRSKLISNTNRLYNEAYPYVNPGVHKVFLNA